jgi:hypothetical protein
MDDRGIARCCGASALASGRPGFSVCSIKPDRCRPGWGDEVSIVALPANRHGGRAPHFAMGGPHGGGGPHGTPLRLGTRSRQGGGRPAERTASRWEAAANPWLGAIGRCSRTGSSNPSLSSRESRELAPAFRRKHRFAERDSLANLDHDFLPFKPRRLNKIRSASVRKIYHS